MEGCKCRISQHRSLWAAEAGANTGFTTHEGRGKDASEASPVIPSAVRPSLPGNLGKAKTLPTTDVRASAAAI